MDETTSTHISHAAGDRAESCGLVAAAGARKEGDLDHPLDGFADSGLGLSGFKLLSMGSHVNCSSPPMLLDDGGSNLNDSTCPSLHLNSCTIPCTGGRHPKHLGSEVRSGWKVCK